MSEQPPIWQITEPIQPYPDGRFDPIPRPLPVWSTPALDPQQPTPEQIADAAREALADMQLVLRIWPYRPLSPLTWMKALVTLLEPPPHYPIRQAPDGE